MTPRLKVLFYPQFHSKKTEKNKNRTRRKTQTNVVQPFEIDCLLDGPRKA